jgi:hypothetical protein
LPYRQLIGHAIAGIKITYAQSATFHFPFPASLQPVGTGIRKSIPYCPIRAERLTLKCRARQAINLRDHAYPHLLFAQESPRERRPLAKAMVYATEYVHRRWRVASEMGLDGVGCGRRRCGAVLRDNGTRKKTAAKMLQTGVNVD